VTPTPPASTRASQGATRRKTSGRPGAIPTCSHYLRILAANPKIKGHSYGFAKDGSQTEDLVRQAHLAVSVRAKYVTIETGGNDICQGHTPVAVPTVRARVTAALQVLRQGLPNSRIFLTSIPWEVKTYDAVYGPYFVAHGYTSDGSTCDPRYDANGVPAPSQEASLQGAVDSYDAVYQQTCAQFVHCRYDGGALGAIKAVLADFAFLNPNDPFVYSHPSVQGHAKMAAASWPPTFDFTDATGPVSKASRAGRVVTLTAPTTPAFRESSTGWPPKGRGRATPSP
jgi:hypothetical protein